jgi:hypothetical protein
MDPSKLKKVATPKAMGAYLKKKAPIAGHGHAMHHPSIREIEYHGHEISIETTYRVKIDGKTVKIPLMVDESGNVHCHSLPNYQFQSALDMVKAMVDLFPNKFPSGKKNKAGPGHTHKHKMKRAQPTRKSSRARRKRK